MGVRHRNLIERGGGLPDPRGEWLDIRIRAMNMETHITVRGAVVELETGDDPLVERIPHSASCSIVLGIMLEGRWLPHARPEASFGALLEQHFMAILARPKHHERVVVHLPPGWRQLGSREVLDIPDGSGLAPPNKRASIAGCTVLGAHGGSKLHHGLIQNAWIPRGVHHLSARVQHHASKLAHPVDRVPMTRESSRATLPSTIGARFPKTIEAIAPAVYRPHREA